jgi:hypothetical protein
MSFCVDASIEQDKSDYFQHMLSLAYLRNIRDTVVRRNFTFLAHFQGRHRSSKSTTAFWFAWLLDPTFAANYQKRVVTSPQQFMDAIADIRKLKRKGCVVIVDEAANTMAASDYYENFMKTIAKVTTMMGYTGVIVFYCSIYKNFVDSRIRRMFHSYYECARYSNDRSIIRPYILRYSTIMKKEYVKHPVINIMGERVTLEQIVVQKPPQFIIDAYENLSIIRKDDMMDGYQEDIKRGMIKEKKGRLNVDELVKTVVDNYHDFESPKMKGDKIRLSKFKLKWTCKITGEQADYVKEAAEKALNLKKSEEQTREEKIKDEELRPDPNKMF